MPSIAEADLPDPAEPDPVVADKPAPAGLMPASLHHCSTWYRVCIKLDWLLCSSHAQCSLLCSAAPKQTYNLSAISSDKLVAELFPKRRTFLAQLVQRQGPMLALLLTSTGMALFSQLVADQVISMGLKDSCL